MNSAGSIGVGTGAGVLSGVLVGFGVCVGVVEAFTVLLELVLLLDFAAVAVVPGVVGSGVVLLVLYCFFFLFFIGFFVELEFVENGCVSKSLVLPNLCSTVSDVLSLKIQALVPT